MSATSGFGGGGVGPVNSVMTLTGNTGGAVSPDGAGNIDTLGGNLINVVGTPLSNTLTWNLVGGTPGQVLITNNTGAVWSNLVSPNNTISIVYNAMTQEIELEANGGGLDLTSLTAETGGAITPTMGTIFIRGALSPYKNITTEGNVVANTMDVRLNDVILWPTSNDGSAGVIYLDAERFLHASAFGGITDGNTFVGYQAGAFNLLNTATENTSAGAGALSSLTGGDKNTAIGTSALIDLTTGSENVALGYGALSAALTSEFSTAVGASAGAFSTGSYNTLLGHSAGINLTTGSSNLYLNHVGVAAENNVMRLGTDGSGFQQVNATYMAGVRARTVASPQQMMVIGNDLKVGSITGVNGAVATMTASGVQMRTMVSPNNTIGIGYISVGTGSPAVTLVAGDAVATSYHTDSGNAAPSANVLNVNGDTNVIGTTGSGNTIHANMLQTTDGWFPIGKTGNPVKYGHLYSSNNSIKIDPDFSNPEPRINLQVGLIAGGVIASAVHNFNLPNIIGATNRTYTIGTQGGQGLQIAYDPLNTLFAGNGAGTPFSFTAPADGIYSFSANIALSNAFSRFFNTFTDANPSTSCVIGQMYLTHIALPNTAVAVGLQINFQINGTGTNLTTGIFIFNSSMAPNNSSNPSGNLAWGNNFFRGWTKQFELTAGDVVTLIMTNVPHPSFVGTPAFADATGILGQTTVGVQNNPYTSYAVGLPGATPATSIVFESAQSTINVTYVRPL